MKPFRIPDGLGAEVVLFHRMSGTHQPESKIKVKGVGQECPTHTICFASHHLFHIHTHGYNFTLRRRRAFVITETELKLMAAAAKMGLSSRPKKG
jgi:hypothetical protein